MPGAVEAVSLLKQAGYRTILVTNQAGVARGEVDPKELTRIHDNMKKDLERAGGGLDAIYMCTHGYDDACDCRKPRPGMLLQAAKDFNVDLTQSVFVGDDPKDLAAGQAAGCPTILVDGKFPLLDVVRKKILPNVGDSRQLIDALKNVRLAGTPILVVGAGPMGKAYVNALSALGADNIHVCARSTQNASSFEKYTANGYLSLNRRPNANEIAIIATPVMELIPCAKHLIALGYKRILCEKPVSLWSREIEALATLVETSGVDFACAFNRIAYPSFAEARSRIRADGGATSAFYTFTELTERLNLQNYAPDVQRRWGVANSLHVMSLAHGVIGLPRTWNAERRGGLSWHPSGSVFVGSGVSDENTAFSFQADWGSAGRWSVEIYTRRAAYRLCPLERLQMKTQSLGEWQDVPVAAFSSDLKPGLAEQVAAFADPSVRKILPLMSLKDAAQLTKFGESVFGYEEASC